MSMWKRKFIRPIVYAKHFDKKYGKDKWVAFNPFTLWSDIKEETGEEPADNVKEKINALKVLKSNELYFSDPKLFEKIILAFNDSFIDTNMLQVCSPQELAYGIPIAREVVGKKDWDEKILRYIQGCCEEWGLIVYPPSFTFAQRKFPKDSLMYAIYQDVKKRKYTLKPSEWQRAIIDNINEYVKHRLTKGGHKNVNN